MKFCLHVIRFTRWMVRLAWKCKKIYLGCSPLMLSWYKHMAGYTVSLEILHTLSKFSSFVTACRIATANVEMKNYPHVGVTVISIIPQVHNVQLWPKTTAQFYCAAPLRSSTAQLKLRSSNCAVWLKMTRHFGARARNYILKINADVYISGFETFAPSAENV